MVAAGIYLTEEEIAILRRMRKKVAELELRMVPSESKHNIDKILG